MQQLTLACDLRKELLAFVAAFSTNERGTFGQVWMNTLKKPEGDEL